MFGSMLVDVVTQRTMQITAQLHFVVALENLTGPATVHTQPWNGPGFDKNEATSIAARHEGSDRWNICLGIDRWVSRTNVGVWKLKQAHATKKEQTQMSHWPQLATRANEQTMSWQSEDSIWIVGTYQTTWQHLSRCELFFSCEGGLGVSRSRGTSRGGRAKAASGSQSGAPLIVELSCADKVNLHITMFEMWKRSRTDESAQWFL